MNPLGVHTECKNGITAMYGQRSKCADLPEGFDTFIVIRKETVNEWEDKRIAER